MYRLTVVYENIPDGKFDFDYYTNVHLPLVMPFIGKSVIKSAVQRGVKGVLDERAPFTAVVHIYLKDLKGLENAFEEHGNEIMDDVPKFTNITPKLNIEEIVEEKSY